MGVVLIIMAVFFYLLPTLVAISNKKQNAVAIFMLNLLLGWAVIGWVVALVWALSKDKQPDIVQVFDDQYEGNSLGYVKRGRR